MRCETAGLVRAELGHHVDEIPCPYGGQLLDDFWTYIGYLAFAVSLQTRMLQGRRYEAAKFEPWTRGLRALFQKKWRGSLGMVRRLRASAEVSTRTYRDYDVLLCPRDLAPHGHQ